MGGGSGRWGQPLHSNKSQPELRKLRGLADFAVLAVTILLPAPVFSLHRERWFTHATEKLAHKLAHKLALEGRLFSRGHLEFQSDSENFETLIIVIPRERLPFD